jgi:hypothetical protein
MNKEAIINEAIIKEVEETIQAQIQHDLDVLQQVKALCSDTYYDEVISYLSEDTTWWFEITKDYDKDYHRWECPEYEFGYVYGKQVSGYLEDEYNGTIYLPLPNKSYLKFFFSC